MRVCARVYVCVCPCVCVCWCPTSTSLGTPALTEGVFTCVHVCIRVRVCVCLHVCAYQRTKASSERRYVGIAPAHGAKGGRYYTNDSAELGGTNQKSRPGRLVWVRKTVRGRLEVRGGLVLVRGCR